MMKQNRAFVIALIAVAFMGGLVLVMPSGVAAQTTLPSVSTNGVSNPQPSSATLSASVNANNVQTEVWFEYGTTSGLGQVTQRFNVVPGTSQVTVSLDLFGLSQNTTYYYRAMARHLPNGSPAQGQTLNFTTGGSNCGAPTVFTNGVVSIGDTYATFQGGVNSLSGTVTYWFEYGTGYGLGMRTTEQTISVASGNTTSFTVLASGLSPNTNYTVQAVARTPCGSTVRGSFVTFITTGYGYGNNNNCQYINGQWYPYGCYGYNQNQYGNCQYLNGQWYPYGCNNYNQYGNNNCQYINGQWYPYGCSGYGNQYGGQQSAPTVVTNTATGIGTNEATFSGTVTANGSMTDAWFEYGTTQSLGSTLPSLSIGDSFSSAPRTTTVQTLRPGTTYYFRLVARNVWGTNRGMIQSFQTAGVFIPTTPTIPTVPQAPTQGNAAVTLNAVAQNEKAAPGEEIVYTINYQNAGSGVARNTTLTVILPTDVELVAAVPAPTTQAGQSLAMNLGDLPPGANGSAIVRARVNPATRTGAILSLTAILDHTDRGGSHSMNANAAVEVGAGTNRNVASVSSFFGDIPGYAWFFVFLLLIVLIVVYAIFRMRTSNGHDAHGGGHH